jgi:hypothetical protein
MPLTVAADIPDQHRLVLPPMRRWTALAIWLAALLAVAAGWSSIGVAQTKPTEAPYKNEVTARECVHKRLSELVAQNRPNIAGDNALAECTKGLQLELKDRKKSYCEAVSYIGWLVSDENSKLNGVKGEPYRPDKASIQRCDKPNTWEKHS